MNAALWIDPDHKFGQVCMFDARLPVGYHYAWVDHRRGL